MIKQMEEIRSKYQKSFVCVLNINGNMAMAIATNITKS